MKKESEDLVQVKPEQNLKIKALIKDTFVSETGTVEENEVEQDKTQKHVHQNETKKSDASHFKSDQNDCWVRCEEPWSDPGEGNSLCMFHDAQRGKYRCEMELEAEALFLICLLCEVQSMKTWCPFVASSERHSGDSHDQLDCNDERCDDACIFYRIVIDPFCTFVLGLMVLYIKWGYHAVDGLIFVHFENACPLQTHTLVTDSYVCFEPFHIQFECDAVSKKTCVSFEIRILKSFMFVPSVFVYAVCREMLACWIKHWTHFARLMQVNSLDTYALNKNMQCKRVWYAKIANDVSKLKFPTSQANNPQI